MRTDFSKITKSSISSYDATVGVGGDYLNVGSAIADGKSNLLLISDVTEITDINTNLNLNINLNYFILNMDSYNFNVNLKNCYIFNGTINFSYSVARVLFYNSRYCFVTNITINNLSTINEARIADTGFFEKVVCNLPNYAYSGFGKYTTMASVNIRNSEIHGGGIDCKDVIRNYQVDSKFNLTNIVFTGTFNLTCATIRNGNYIYYKGANNTTIIVYNVTNLFDISNKLEVSVINTLTNFSCYKLNTRDHYVHISNGVVDNTLFFNYDDPTIVNITVKGATNITKNNIILNSCKLHSVVVSGNNNTITNCILLTNTITINATADKTNISNCRTLTSIIDNGTNTILQNNQLI